MSLSMGRRSMLHGIGQRDQRGLHHSPLVSDISSHSTGWERITTRNRGYTISTTPSVIYSSSAIIPRPTPKGTIGPRGNSSE